MKRTRITRGWILALAALICVLALTGCKALTPEEQLQKALENMQNIQSMEATMTMTLNMNLMGQQVDAKSVSKMTSFQDPLKVKMEVAAEVAGEKGGSVVYLQQEGEAMTAYAYDGANWTHDVLTGEDLESMLEQVDPKVAMDLYLGNLSSFTAGVESLDGAACYKLQGVLTGEALVDAMRASGALDSVDPTLQDSEQFDRLFSGLGDLPVSVWIEQKTLYPVRYTMDMTALMDSLMANMLVELGDTGGLLQVEISNCQVEMVCANFNKATEFDIPAEALAS
jgi:hypothetical protein